MYTQSLYNKTCSNATFLASSSSIHPSMDPFAGQMQLSSSVMMHSHASTTLIPVSANKSAVTAIQQNPPAEIDTTPAPNAQPTSFVSSTTFWAVVAAFAGVLGLIVVFQLWQLYKRRARRLAAREDAARARELSQGVTPPITLETMVSPPSTESPAVHSTPQPQPVSQPQGEPIVTPPIAAHTNPERPAQDDPLQRRQRERARRAAMQRLNALREVTLKKATERGIHAAKPDDTVEEEDAAWKRANENPYALEDTMSRSDDSHFDLIRRPPAVNPEYQARRDERYRQKIAEGYTHEQAMSVSEASTDDSDDPGPFGPRHSTILPGANVPSSQRQPVKPQLAPPNVPDRWQPVEPDAEDDDGGELLRKTRYDPSEHSKKKGQTVTGVKEEAVPSKIKEGEGDSVSRRPSYPTLPRPLSLDSRRMSQARIAWTESTEDDAVSTVISDDPWRDEVRENRRLGR